MNDALSAAADAKGHPWGGNPLENGEIRCCSAFLGQAGRETRARRAHLVGIAGTGMRSLATVLLQWGWRLSGSDVSRDLPQLFPRDRIATFSGHFADHVPRNADEIIYSDAIPPDNPELLRAAELGIPAYSYFQTLGRLMASGQGIAVAGTHGKSTTTAMLAELLLRAGLDPTAVVGATPIGEQTGGRAGNGRLMLVEACEYRANFLHLTPLHAAILGIEPDHFDYYKSCDQLESAFSRFATSLPPDGFLIAAKDCETTARVVANAKCQVETFGFTPSADWSADEITCHRGRYAFRLLHCGEPLGEVRLRVPGRHNVLNVLAAAALARANRVSREVIAEGLSRFKGLQRRLEIVGGWRGVTWIDDYAHHPTEITAGLETVRQMYPSRRVWCLFQPHQVSRTRCLLDELAASLQNADKVIIAEIFHCRETPQIGDVTAVDLAERVRRLGGIVTPGHRTEPIVRRLQDELAPGDVLVTMGAGNVRRIGDEIFERVREDRAAG